MPTALGSVIHNSTIPIALKQVSFTTQRYRLPSNRCHSQLNDTVCPQTGVIHNSTIPFALKQVSFITQRYRLPSNKCHAHSTIPFAIKQVSRTLNDTVCPQTSIHAHSTIPFALKQVSFTLISVVDIHQYTTHSSCSFKRTHQCQSLWWWWWRWLFTRMRGFGKRVRPFIPRLRIFIKVEVSSRTLISSLGQDQSTVAKPAETTVAECSLTSCV